MHDWPEKPSRRRSPPKSPNPRRVLGHLWKQSWDGGFDDTAKRKDNESAWAGIESLVKEQPTIGPVGNARRTRGFFFFIF